MDTEGGPCGCGFGALCDVGVKWVFGIEPSTGFGFAAMEFFFPNNIKYQKISLVVTFQNNVGPILGGSMLLFCRAEKLSSRKNLFVFRKQAKFKS